MMRIQFQRTDFRSRIWQSGPLPKITAVNVPRKEFGFNRLRYLWEHCLTVLLYFPNASQNNVNHDLTRDIRLKVNTLRFGHISIDLKDGGEALFVFDRRIRRQDNIRLKGWLVALGAIADFPYIIYAPACRDYHRVNSWFSFPSMCGAMGRKVLDSEVLVNTPIRENTMADTLIGNPGITADLSEAVINMAPGFVEHPFFAMPWRLDKAIHAPIELPSGEKRTVDQLIKPYTEPVQVKIRWEEPPTSGKLPIESVG